MKKRITLIVGAICGLAITGFLIYCFWLHPEQEMIVHPIVQDPRMEFVIGDAEEERNLTEFSLSTYPIITTGHKYRIVMDISVSEGEVEKIVYTNSTTGEVIERQYTGNSQIHDEIIFDEVEEFGNVEVRCYVKKGTLATYKQKVYVRHRGYEKIKIMTKE